MDETAGCSSSRRLRFGLSAVVSGGNGLWLQLWRGLRRHYQSSPLGAVAPSSVLVLFPAFAPAVQTNMPYLMGPARQPLAPQTADHLTLATGAHQSDNATGGAAPRGMREIDTIMGDNDIDQSHEDRSRRLKAKNRRKRYLEVHPEYFDDYSLELADPLLYDHLIRRFQTAAERETEGRRKGFSGTLTTDLWRTEAKKDALSNPNPASLFAYSRGPYGEIREVDKDEVPMSKEEGKTWWVDEMTQRFLRGDDNDFDYNCVDGNDRYDDPEEERDIQDAYFESMESDFDTDGEGKEKVLTGETGIQDY